MRKDKFIRECVYDLIRDCENELEDIFGMEFLIRKKMKERNIILSKEDVNPDIIECLWSKYHISNRVLAELFNVTPSWMSAYRKRNLITISGKSIKLLVGLNGKYNEMVDGNNELTLDSINKYVDKNINKSNTI